MILFYYKNKAKRATVFIIVLALCLGMVGCGDTTGSEKGERQGRAEQSNLEQVLGDNYASGVYDDWADRNPVYVGLEGVKISVNGKGAIAEGSVLAIHSAGVYVLSGTLDDGQIVVQATEEDTVQIVLNSASITCSHGAPLYAVEAGMTVITLADGTDNYVSDGVDYTDGGTDEPDAAIFCKNDLIVTGSGSLTVQGNYNNGIGTKDNLLIESGTLMITAANHGIRGRDSVTVLDGNFVIRSGNDGIQSNNGNEGKGWILLSGGSYDLQTENDGIQAESTLTITGGIYSIIAGGGSGMKHAVQDGSYKGLKAGTHLMIEDGVFDLNCADDTIHANGNVTINGGTLRLASGDDGVHADQDLLINGGVIDISTSYEGLEGQTVTVNEGAIRLYATDDGINAAGGNESGGENRPFVANENNRLTINGGTIVVTAEGDGVDSNGYIFMTGGRLIVNGPVRSGDAALDYDGSFEISGGVLVAAGSSGMAQAPGNDSTQNTLQIYYSNTQSGGTVVHLTDEDGNALLTFTPARDYQNIVISLPGLEQDKTYLLYTGGSDNGAAQEGLVLNGGYLGGTLLTEITLDSALTRVSDSGEAVSGGIMGMGGSSGGRRPNGNLEEGERPDMEGIPGRGMPADEGPGGRGKGNVGSDSVPSE